MSVFPMGQWRLYTACLVLYAVLMSQSSIVHSVDVTIGVLGPWDAPESYAYPLLGRRTAGAVPLALDQIRDEGILGNNTLNFVYRDTRCDTRRASGSAVDLHLFTGVHVFIGLPCSEPCRSVRDLSAYWDIPFISWFCPQTPATAVDDTYDSFARTFVPFSGLSYLPGAVMTHYEFTSASVVYADAPLWSALADTVLTTMINTGVTISNLQSYTGPLDVQKAVTILQKVKHVSHVIWLIMGGVTTLEGDEQIFMLAADQLGMTGGQQVFFRLELFPDVGHTTPWSPVLVDGNATSDRAAPNEDSLRLAYEALMIVTYRLPQDGRIEELLGRVSESLTDPGFDLYKKKNTSTPSIMAAFLYDAVLLFAYAAKQHVEINGNEANNSYTRTNVTFEGMTGYVVLDSAGDRIANFSLLDLKDGGQFEAVGHVTGTLPVFEEILGTEVWWPGTAIPTEPKCGYQGENCLESSVIIAIVVGSLVTLMLFIIVPYLSLKYRKYVLRKDWLIEIDELTFLPLQNSTFGIGLQGYPSTFRLPNISGRLLSQQSLASQSVQEKLRKESQTMSPDFTLAKYKSETVVLRRAKVTNGLTLNKVTKKELKEMRWLVHDNLNRFMGVCFPTRGDSSMFYYISEYCPKGNLKTVLANDDIKLDLSFKVSFINDLARGMQFLHNSVVKSHGLLCSNLCFIDSRWALKIAGFGSVSFHMSRGTATKMDPEDRFSRLLWTSPELLRHELPTKGSQKGDVYSFGILIEEILTRSLPYHDSGMSSREIIRRVMTRQEPPFRPRKAASEDDLRGLSTQLSMSDGIVTCLAELMMQCWEEHPEDRPDFNIIRHRLRTMQKGRKELNLMDNMVSKMEKYTENLEQVVADRTGQLLEEKKKTDALLYRMLPQAVADELKKGQSFHGEFYDQVTLYFSDIVGFTELSAMSAPMEVVDLLNDLYTCFDAILERFDVYKVETIGDAYMVASGLPNRNGNRHASEIASMALAVREGVKTFRIRHMPEHHVQIRIGINSGPVAAGVVGLTMPRFCLFGDTVNTASRMESHGMPQRIHVNWSTATLLTSIGGYRLEVRGQLKIKGKGVMTTFWLLGTDEQYSGLQIQDDLQNNSAKKISTDTVISEDSLLSPPSNEPQDLMQDSLIASRVPEELPSDFLSEGSSASSSPRRRRTGNGNSYRDLSQQSRNDATTETLKTLNEEEHSNAKAKQGTGDATTKTGDVTSKTRDVSAKTGGINKRTDEIRTRNGGIQSGSGDLGTKTSDQDTKTEEHSSKANVLVTRPSEIVSTTADMIVEEGSYVRTESGDIVQTPSGNILRRPSRQHQPRLGSLREDSASLPNGLSLPNVPSLPDIRVHSEEPATGRHDSVFSYTVPLPQLMNEISTVMDSSVNIVEVNHQNS